MQDFKNLGARKVCVMTDKNVGQLDAAKVALDALSKAGVPFEVYDNIRVEPTDIRWK